MNHESTFLVSYELPFMDLYQRPFGFLLTNSTHRYYLSIHLCLWMWKKVNIRLILTKSNFLHHIDVVDKPNKIGWIENDSIKSPSYSQTNSHQLLTNFPKVISYCIWISNVVGSRPTYPLRLIINIKTWNQDSVCCLTGLSLLVTIQNMPFSICFHSHNLMCPSYFLLGRWQIKCHLI